MACDTHGWRSRDLHTRTHTHTRPARDLLTPSGSNAEQRVCGCLSCSELCSSSIRALAYLNDSAGLELNWFGCLLNWMNNRWLVVFPPPPPRRTSITVVNVTDWLFQLIIRVWIGAFDKNSLARVDSINLIRNEKIDYVLVALNGN